MEAAAVLPRRDESEIRSRVAQLQPALGPDQTPVPRPLAEGANGRREAAVPVWQAHAQDRHAIGSGADANQPPLEGGQDAEDQGEGRRRKDADAPDQDEGADRPEVALHVPQGHRLPRALSPPLADCQNPEGRVPATVRVKVRIMGWGNDGVDDNNEGDDDDDDDDDDVFDDDYDDDLMLVMLGVDDDDYDDDAYEDL